MPDQASAEDPFEWTQLPVDPRDARAVARNLQAYVESQLRSGQTEDAIREQLLAAQMPADYVTDLFVAVHQTQRGLVAPDPVWRSGPYDFGGLFDSLANAEIDRHQRRQDRKSRQQKSARLAASEPDPTFSLEGAPSYAQVLAGQANREGKRWWLGMIILAFVCFPFLFIGLFCVLSIFK